MPTGARGRAGRAADVALVFAGLSSDWESEGFDRPDLDLPGRQDELIAQVASGQPATPWSCSTPARPSPCPGWTRWRRSCRPGIPARSAATPSPMCCLAMSTPPASCRRPSHCAWRITRLPQLPWRERQGPLRRGDLRRLPLLREEAHRAALSLRLRPLVHDLWLRALRLSAARDRPGRDA